MATPSGDATRPTTDRVRESVFSQIASWLGVADRDPAEQLAGRSFLDLYAGSGAVGIEALSRGARTTWVEKDPATARVIRKNLTDLRIDGSVLVQDVVVCLKRRATPFDIVWMDPPYPLEDEQVNLVVALLDAKGWVAPGGRVLVERSVWSSAVEFPESFLNHGSRRFGSTIIYYAEKGSQ